MFKSIITAIIRRRFWVIAVIFLMTAFFAAQVRDLKIVIDPSTMLPKLHPNVVGTNVAEALFGSKYMVVVGVNAVDGSTALSPEVLSTVARLSTKIADEFDVYHESPQILLIVNGECIYDESHSGISMDMIEETANSAKK